MPKLIYGVGINDSTIPAYVSGRQSPLYRCWMHMLQRCHSQTFKENNPSYAECTVTEQWHSFEAFRLWASTESWEGNELDKDLLCPGNKHYSPETCVFIPKRVNNILQSGERCGGTLPFGVTFEKQTKRYKASCSDGNGRYVTIGRYATPEAAGDAYKSFKRSVIHSLADDANLSEKVRMALLRRYP